VPEFPSLRIYLDSNVLLSASINELSPFRDFWRLSEVGPVLSRYAVGEVTRNLQTAEHNASFAELIRRSEMVSDLDARIIPVDVRLVSKDAPILAAAIGASVDYLATGDRKHFSHLYNTIVSGVRIISPGEFLDTHEDRLLK
jgi:predicted nucleic acid-binding protein